MNEATQRQIEAARPGRSTWLSANAGSGKTRVLTDRVARLLLGGVAPQNILCLTYTKAAASEMQNRLFKTLGAWAMLPEDDLRATLEDLTGGEHVPSAQLAEARRLFAKAVETPGGLRIQTIHSFCAILLRKFPVEAQVSPQFTEMDDRSAELLRDECLEILAERDDGTLLDMARVLNGGNMRPFIAALTAERDAFADPMDEASLRDLLGLPRDVIVEQLPARTLSSNDLALLGRVVPVMAASDKTTNHGHAQLLSGLKGSDAAALEVLESIFLPKTGANAGRPKLGKVPTKKAREALDPDDATALDDLMERVADARTARLSLVSLHRNLVLHRFAAAFLPIYAQAKADRGWLDFDDLILKARDLLTDSRAAQWVLYKLDGGIDHILVDEAQDTSPAQWQMIEALAQEAAAGHGTRDTGARTIFVVGDKKQSIYSFQGADPEGFGRMFDRFAGQLGADAISRLDMLYSFRSSSAILNAVDATFADQEMEHRAFHENLPGRVDLWPLIEPAEGGEPRDFDDPVDLVSPADATVQLAELVARRIRAMIATDNIPNVEDKDNPGEFRPVHAGDILILFRSRGPLFDATIRACKAAGIPMAGADRLTLTAELAVKDIQALLSFLATPEDSLSLAAALKSPLFGWNEQALFDLAAKRSERYLWEALRAQGNAHPRTMDILNDLRAQAGYLRPYELIERILTRHAGRARLVGRLGGECVEAIDALLSQALLYERTDIPSLTGFLSWLEGDDIQIKRQSEGKGSTLRVMTIHGAKGLEAPIVILPDTMAEAPRKTGEFWPAGDCRVLRENQQNAPPALHGARDALLNKQAAERDRLLYVAMTRAQFWLIVAGAGTDAQADARWYGRVRAGLDRLDCTGLPDPACARRHEVGDWAEPVAARHPETDAPMGLDTLPDWIDGDAPVPTDQARVLSPSGLGGAKIVMDGTAVDDGAADALARGTELHALLEHLPVDRPDAWADLAPRILPGLDPDILDARLAEARRVLCDEDLRDLFVQPAMTEVAVTAPLPAGGAIAGAIDRLIVTSDRVLAIDYKSNRVMPHGPDDVPEGLLRQMGGYDHALSLIYPGRRIDTALLWTEAPALMILPQPLVRAAFGRAVDLDGPPGAA